MNQPTPNREPVIDQLVEVWTSLRTACDGLRPAEWEATTDCPGWRVRDHLAHQIGIERMLLGESVPTPPARYPEHVRNPLGEVNEAWVESRRGTPGHELLREFGELADRRVEKLRALPTEQFDVVSENLLGRMPYRQFLRIRVIDSWAHEQDIRRAVGRSGGRNGAGETVIVEGCAHNMTRIVAKDAAAPDGSVVVFNVTGLLGRQIVVGVSGGRGTALDAAEAAAPTASLTMDQEAFWLLCLGRVAPLRLLGTGQVRVDGDVVLGHRVLDAMAFIT